jgi:hypothetical protein
MNLFSTVLTIHVLSVLVLIAGLSFEALILFRVRRSSTAAEAAGWIGLVPGPKLKLMGLGSAIILLLTGIYMTTLLTAWSLAWPKFAVVTVILITPVAAFFGKQMMLLHQDCAAGKLEETELRRRLLNSKMKTAFAIKTALILGLVLLMTTKPGMTGSLIILLGVLVVGFAWASRNSKNTPTSQSAMSTAKS